MRNSRGVSLTELVVVLAIISVLLFILLPAVHVARVRARELVCKNNLKQMHIALLQIRDTSGVFPATPPPGRFGGWMIEILPFIEQGNVRNNIELGAATSESPEFNRPPSTFICPAREILGETPSDGMWPAHYVASKGWGVSDAPLNLSEPWGCSPERSYDNAVERVGPHHGGFYFVWGELHGVQFREGTDPDSKSWWQFD